MSDAQLDAIRRSAFGFEIDIDAFGPLVDRIGTAEMVLLGEASHGTQEFYDVRAAITEALILQKGFNLVAVEADWPDAYRVNRWVRGAPADADAESALGDFVRFPRWMWRNTSVVRFLRWLHGINAARAADERVGFYGLDLYSLHSSMAAVLAYLGKVDPAAAERARQRYACFDHHGGEPQSYGHATALGLSRSCEDEVVEQLIELRRRAAEYATRNGRIAADDYFFAEQNARLVRSAEQYYRAMFGGRAESWNLRDTHMMQTLDALLAHVRQTSGSARAVVWAHNSHLGDARATDMARFGELNLGQLVRERPRSAAYLVGFTTHTGTVTAAADWDEPAVRMQVRPSLAGSWERLFHDCAKPRFLLLLDEPPLREPLAESRLERAIGVIYRPSTERASHYLHARLGAQFDAVLHIDETRALEPLERWSRHEADLPDTYPSTV